MKIEIDTLTKQTYKHDFEKEIIESLRVIPSHHLVKLNKIIVQYHPPFHNDRAMGSYFGIREGAKEPYILMSSKNIMSCFPYSIPFLTKFAFRFYLRYTLYHEIGHHSQRLVHGIKKREWEDDAELYRRYMQVKKYETTFLGKIFFSFVFFLKGKIKGTE